MGHPVSSTSPQLARSKRPDPDGISMCASSNALLSEIIAPTSLQTHQQGAIASGDTTAPAPSTVLITTKGLSTSPLHASHVPYPTTTCITSSKPCSPTQTSTLFQTHHQQEATAPIATVTTTRSQSSSPHNSSHVPYPTTTSITSFKPRSPSPTLFQTHHQQEATDPISTVITTRGLSSSPHNASHVPYPTTTSITLSKQHSPSPMLPSLQPLPSLHFMSAIMNDNVSEGISEAFSSPDSSMSLFMKNLDEVIESAAQDQTELMSDLNMSTTLSINVSATAKAEEFFERSISLPSHRSCDQTVTTMKPSQPHYRECLVKKRKHKDSKHRMIKRSKTNASHSTSDRHKKTTGIASSSNDHILDLLRDMGASRRVLSTSRESGQGKFAKVLDRT